MPWTKDELNQISQAEELLIAPRRKDGTLHKQVIIWVVRVGDDLYVRCVNGRDGKWFRWTQAQHAGRIQAGGVVKDVDFVEVTDPQVISQVDEAYRVKYRRYPQYVAPLFTATARSATIKLVPHGND